MSDPTDLDTRTHPPARALVVSLALLAASGVTSAAGNVLIAVGFPDRPAPEDLLLRLLPAWTWAQYVTEVAIIGSLALIAVYVLRHARDEFADVVAIFGVMYLIRSVLMVLTPLANANGDGQFGFIPLDQLGMFPSGHVAASLLVLMMIDARRAPGMKRLALTLVSVQWVALLLSHAHYSIDIAGGALLGYFVYREWEDGRLFGPVKRLMGIPS
jgi:membrane-associated phospholipid phosphatase